MIGNNHEKYIISLLETLEGTTKSQWVVILKKQLQISKSKLDLFNA